MRLLPSDKKYTQCNKERRVGVEIEFAGITGNLACTAIQSLFGGKIIQEEPLLLRVVESYLGDFRVELDSAPVKKIASDLAHRENQYEQGSLVLEALQKGVKQASEFLIPWEIVSPPIPHSKLKELDSLINKLRDLGAQGTRHASRFAFGVHLNPELPALDSRTICRYLKAYLCLQDALVEHEKIDITRHLAGHAAAFDSAYTALVTHEDYWPETTQLIEDYLSYNCTRNRSLDLLPLFSHLDKALVLEKINDSRIQPRPTFHYRLPNSDIDNPSWSLDHAWLGWLKVEELASNEHKLQRICTAYQNTQQQLKLPLNKRWQKFTQRAMEF